jgi:hypothetical protein
MSTSKHVRRRAFGGGQCEMRPVGMLWTCCCIMNQWRVWSEAAMCRRVREVADARGGAYSPHGVDIARGVSH